MVKIALVALGLGGVFGSCILALVSGSNSNFSKLYVYGMVLVVYHINEFYCTYNYQTSKVSQYSFLIWGNKGNREFWFMQILTIGEFLFHQWRYIDLWLYQDNVFVHVGALMVISGLSIRHLAMKTCGESFDHHIQVQTKENHKLITLGVYQYWRHPSYFGFWCLVVGLQVFLLNYASLCLNLFVLAQFFQVRIQFEEWYLIHKIFGEEYVQYRKKVGINIPFVKIRLDLEKYSTKNTTSRTD